jgi:hypothetical protein
LRPQKVLGDPVRAGLRCSASMWLCPRSPDSQRSIADPYWRSGHSVPLAVPKLLRQWDDGGRGHVWTIMTTTKYAADRMTIHNPFTTPPAADDPPLAELVTGILRHLQELGPHAAFRSRREPEGDRRSEGIWAEQAPPKLTFDLSLFFGVHAQMLVGSTSTVASRPQVTDCDANPGIRGGYRASWKMRFRK